MGCRRERLTFTVRTGNILSRATLGGRSEGSNPRPRKRSEASLIGVRRTTCARRLQPGRGPVLGNQRLQRRVCVAPLGLISGHRARAWQRAGAHAGRWRLSDHTELPSATSRLWAAAAGASGGLALLIFYRALSKGMGLTAPVAAVLGAAIPAAFTMITHGLPGKLGLAGFLLAGLGIWLISRPDGSGSDRGIFTAVLAGIGFAGFFLCINRTGESSPLWSAAFSRIASFLLVGAIVLIRR